MSTPSAQMELSTGVKSSTTSSCDCYENPATMALLGHLAEERMDNFMQRGFLNSSSLYAALLLAQAGDGHDSSTSSSENRSSKKPKNRHSKHCKSRKKSKRIYPPSEQLAPNVKVQEWLQKCPEKIDLPADEQYTEEKYHHSKENAPSSRSSIEVALKPMLPAGSGDYDLPAGEQYAEKNDCNWRENAPSSKSNREVVPKPVLPDDSGDYVPPEYSKHFSAGSFCEVILSTPQLSGGASSGQQTPMSEESSIGSECITQ